MAKIPNLCDFFDSDDDDIKDCDDEGRFRVCSQTFVQQQQVEFVAPNTERKVNWVRKMWDEWLLELYFQV